VNCSKQSAGLAAYDMPFLCYEYGVHAKDASLKDYEDFVKRTNEAFAMSAARTISSDDVAKAIFEAATDGTALLRHLVGNDTRGFIKARQELSDQDYIEFVRSQFPTNS
jgi:hypothetical protein